MRVVTLTINGHDVSGQDDETVLDISRANRINIPTLCQLDGISTWGGCRLCLVEVEGRAESATGLYHYVAEDMVVLHRIAQIEKLPKDDHRDALQRGQSYLFRLRLQRQL